MQNRNSVRFSSAVAPYAGAAAATVATIATCAFLGGVLAERPFIPLYFVVVLVTLLAGLGPGIFATLISALGAAWLLLPPIGAMAVSGSDAHLRLAAFTFIALASAFALCWTHKRNLVALQAAVAQIRRLTQEEADATLRQSEERYRLLFEASRDGIATVDLTGRLQDANPAFAEMLGYSLEELRRLSYQDLTPARWHKDEEAIIRDRLLRDADSGEYEKEYIRKDGLVFPVSLRAWPIRDGGGNLIGFGAIVRDITERKRAEEALKAADRRKDEFLATLAHELRNPLAPIRNAVYLLKQGGSFSRERDGNLVAIAERQVEHMIRLVNELLDFSRISTGKVDLKREHVDLVDVLRHAAETAQPTIQARAHELRLDLPGEPLNVDGDPVRLAQVFTNLLDNAAKYTDEGGMITLTAERRAGEAVVTVRDNGLGISPDMLPQIFQCFTQVKQTFDRAKGGLGIGLSLVRTLVQLHGGSVEAESAGLGGGSAFTVRLPALAGAAVPASASTPLVRTTRRVLIVDDERDVADSFAAVLAAFGAMARVAYCGHEGLEAVKSFRPEVVLLDLGMAPPDGFETARRIRALPEGRDLALIALSGWGEAQVAPRVRAAGFDGHLTKPAELPALNALLASLESPAAIGRVGG